MVVRSLLTLALIVSLAAGVAAQQPNNIDATLVINGATGPNFPITGVTVFSGVNSTMNFQGLSGAPISVGASPNLSVGYATTPIGIFDLDFATTEVLVNGQFAVEPTGSFTLTIPVPTNVTAGQSVSYQCAILSLSAPNGAALSAATQITTAIGIVGANLPLGDDNALSVSFSTYSLIGAFYANTYTNCFVNANGSVSFGSSDGGDFTATGPEFRSGPPRAAAFWTDLSPNAGGNVNWQIDFTQPLPTLSVNWVNVPSGFGAGGQYSHTVEIQLTPTGVSPPAGDVRLINPANNPPSPYDTVSGITAGGNLGSQTSPIDLSLAQASGGFTGGPNDAIYEFYAGTTSTTGIPGPAFDLTATTLNFLAVGVGSNGASYFMF